jgi:hypothetical protein
MVPERATEPRLRKPGLVIVAVLFVWIAVASAVFTVRQDKAHFVASVHQFTWAAILVVLVLAAAFSLPKTPRCAGAATNPLIAGTFALVARSSFLLVGMGELSGPLLAWNSSLFSSPFSGRAAPVGARCIDWPWQERRLVVCLARVRPKPGDGESWSLDAHRKCRARTGAYRHADGGSTPGARE